MESICFCFIHQFTNQKLNLIHQLTVIISISFNQSLLSFQSTKQNNQTFLIELLVDEWKREVDEIELLFLFFHWWSQWSLCGPPGRPNALPFNSFLLFCLAQRESKKKRELMDLPRCGAAWCAIPLKQLAARFPSFTNCLHQLLHCGRANAALFSFHSLSSSFAHSLSSSLSCRLSFLGRSHCCRSSHNPPKDKARRAGGVHSLTFAPLNARFTPIHKPQRGPNAFNLNLSFNQSSH